MTTSATGPGPTGFDHRVVLVGLHGGVWWGEQAEAALRQADVLVGSADQRADLMSAGLQGEWIEMWGKDRLDEIVELCAQRAAAGAKVCLLTSGDPGFFGLLEQMAERFGRDGIVVHPAPTSVALAFARIAVPWDDATVVNCHTRSAAEAASVVASQSKVAVLASRHHPPQALGREVMAADPDLCREVWVCTRLGERAELVTTTDLHGLSTGSFDHVSVVVFLECGYTGGHNVTEVGPCEL